jgi:hypothetical protein
MFNLRTLMTNFIVDFGFTFADLAVRAGVAKEWAAHVDLADRGKTPRKRWRSEASEAVELLRSAEFAAQPVRFICEAQMLLDDVYQVRKHMHEVRRGGRRACCFDLFSRARWRLPTFCSLPITVCS